MTTPKFLGGSSVSVSASPADANDLHAHVISTASDGGIAYHA